MAKKNDTFNPSRRKFIKGAALTVGTTGLAGTGGQLNAAPQKPESNGTERRMSLLWEPAPQVFPRRSRRAIEAPP